jgi:adenylate cyclase
VTDPHSRSKNAREAGRNRHWPTYLGITGLLLFILVALAGGIIWYNSTKSSELAIAAAQRLMQETDGKIRDRIKLLYDPMYAIVGIASLVPGLTTPAIKDNPSAIALMLRALRIYPQILSLYVGFDDGQFFMVTHIAGEKSAALRKALQAPPEAVFANEIVTADPSGKRSPRWVFLGDDGVVVGRRDQAPPFDPRQRPWYMAAKHSNVVEHSDLYIFASSAEPGFTLSRSFGGTTPGVMGADLAAVDLANFMREQRITRGSTAFIFTKTGRVVALPDQSVIAKALRADGQSMAAPPKIAELHDPVIAGLVAAYQSGQMAGTRIYDVAGRTYIGRVVEIPPRYGRDQLLAITVPVDEIEMPISKIRNDTLLYSIAFLVFALPLYVTLVVAWIDRRLAARAPWPQFRDDE